MGVLTTPMALVLPLDPNKSRSRNEHQTCGLDDVFPLDNLGVLDDMILLLFPVWFQVYISIE